MATGHTDITDIGRIDFTVTSLMDITVGEGEEVIIGVEVTAEDMDGEEYMVAVGMDGAVVDMAGEGMVGIEMNLCTNIFYSIRLKVY